MNLQLQQSTLLFIYLFSYGLSWLCHYEPSYPCRISWILFSLFILKLEITVLILFSPFVSVIGLIFFVVEWSVGCLIFCFFLLKALLNFHSSLSILSIWIDGLSHFWHYRLTNVEELTRATIKKLTQGMDEHNKAMAAAKSDEAKSNIVSSPLIKPMIFHIALP